MGCGGHAVRRPADAHAGQRASVLMLTVRTKAILFDLDGTLVNSTAVVVRVWSKWAKRNGVPVEELLPISHGRPALLTMRHFRPDLPDLHEQVLAHVREEESDATGIVPIPGARELLATIPAERWGIVTSCPPRLANLRRTAAGLPEPRVLVTVDDVVNGKPAPDCFLLGAERLGFAPEDCVVVEDSAAGIRAGLDAGMRVLGLT